MYECNRCGLTSTTYFNASQTSQLFNQHCSFKCHNNTPSIPFQISTSHLPNAAWYLPSYEKTLHYPFVEQINGPNSLLIGSFIDPKMHSGTQDSESRNGGH